MSKEIPFVYDFMSLKKPQLLNSINDKGLLNNNDKTIGLIKSQLNNANLKPQTFPIIDPLMKKTENTTESFHKSCQLIQFNDSILPSSQIDNNVKGVAFGDETDYTLPDNSYQYIVGRVNTLQKIHKTLSERNGTGLYNNPKIKILDLADGTNKYNWSITLNDLFLYCAKMYDMQKNTLNEKNKTKFAIRLVYDKSTCNNTINKTCNFSSDSCPKYESSKIAIAQTVCIDTGEALGQTYDTVTIREIGVIGKIFGMSCYKWIGSNPSYSLDKDIETYFFSSNEKVDDRNVKKVDINFVEKQSGGNIYLIKYLKLKYLALKKVEI
jgi:hypothetical protein